MTFLIDPRNTTKPYNFCFFKTLVEKDFSFEFIGYIPSSWGGESPVKENNMFLPLSRGIFENKRIQRFIGNFTQTLEIFFGHLRLNSLMSKNDTLHFLWFTAPSIERYILHCLKSTKIIHTAHNLLPHREWRGDFVKFKRLYSSSDKVVVHDRETALEFRNSFKLDTPVEVIPHGNLEIFYRTFDITSASDSKNFWMNYKSNLNRPVFLFMGPVKKYKGFEVLREAMKILNRDNLKYSVVIKDSRGPGLENLQYLPVEVPYSKLGLIYRNADVVVLPHTRISQSVTLFEAGYFKIPVIVSSVGGFKETVRDGIDGFIFDNKDPESLADKMKKVINSSPEEIREKGMNFKEYLIDAYSWEKITERWIEIYLNK